MPRSKPGLLVMCFYMVEDSGIEPLTQACKASVFPIRLIPQNLLLTIYPSLRRQQRRVYGPCDTIRTCDHLVPNQELYQAELHTGKIGSPSWIRTTLHGLTVRCLHLDCSWGIYSNKCSASCGGNYIASSN